MTHESTHSGVLDREEDHLAHERKQEDIASGLEAPRKKDHPKGVVATPAAHVIVTRRRRRGRRKQPPPSAPAAKPANVNFCGRDLHRKPDRHRSKMSGRSRDKVKRLQASAAAAQPGRRRRHTVKWDSTKGYPGEGPTEALDEMPWTFPCERDQCNIAGHYHRRPGKPFEGARRRAAEKKRKKAGNQPRAILCTRASEGSHCDDPHCHHDSQVHDYFDDLKCELALEANDEEEPPEETVTPPRRYLSSSTSSARLPPDSGETKPLQPATRRRLPPLPKQQQLGPRVSMHDSENVGSQDPLPPPRQAAPVALVEEDLVDQSGNDSTPSATCSPERKHCGPLFSPEDYQTSYPSSEEGSSEEEGTSRGSDDEDLPDLVETSSDETEDPSDSGSDPEEDPCYTEYRLIHLTSRVTCKWDWRDLPRHVAERVAGLFIDPDEVRAQNDAHAYLDREQLDATSSTHRSYNAFGVEVLTGVRPKSLSTSTIGGYHSSYRGLVYVHLFRDLQLTQALFKRSVMSEDGKVYSSLVAATLKCVCEMDAFALWQTQPEVLANTVMHYVNTRVSSATRLREVVAPDNKVHFRTAAPSSTARRRERS